MNTTIITGKRDEIRDACEMSFFGNVLLANGRNLAGNVTPCDIVSGRHTGEFTHVTVSSTRSGAFRRVALSEIKIIEIWDI